MPVQVRDFRGAMICRADKESLSPPALSLLRKEAVRDGVPPIELVDGEKLVPMLEQLEMGLKPRRMYEIDPGFVDSFK